jgi:hypothetical protein
MTTIIIIRNVCEVINELPQCLKAVFPQAVLLKTVLWENLPTIIPTLLLFYPIMFSAITFVKADDVIQAGYSSKTEAREDFYKKLKVLYYLAS